ncbi:MAG: PQQ-dependent sugar dehydrogenase [Anaerolineales bacterium]|nr:PQQ-dependent sugar dehydrogenase [Anaerolineales bacterium]MDW8447842.1 PQQ-dependent sugar dehydrogenase [Anaerolineales bacterium]
MRSAYRYAFFLVWALVACQPDAIPHPTPSPTDSLSLPTATRAQNDQPLPPDGPLPTNFPPLPIATAVARSASTLDETTTPTATASGEESLAPSEPSLTPESALLSSAFPNPAHYQWTPIVRRLKAPVGLGYPPDGTGRLMILEQAGVIRLWQSGTLASTPFLDLRDRVGSRGSEQGLLGIAFHPSYAENGYFYVNYTDRNGDTVIARFRADPPSANSADATTEKILLRVAQPYANHNGGAVVFGPDGYLYLGLGDGGAAGDPENRAQALDTLLGKILRIDVDHGDPYAIPASNPLASGVGLPEIWAYGLRNPWRISFDRQTGDLYIGDVGQNLWEEINYLPHGSSGDLNFGWKYFEGTHPYEGIPPAGQKFISPIYEYGHDQGCSVTGGIVYRGKSLPEWNGVYLFGDYCAGWVDGLRRLPDGTWQAQRLFRDLGRISSFGEDEQGEVYVINHAGEVYRLERR